MTPHDPAERRDEDVEQHEAELEKGEFNRRAFLKLAGFTLGGAALSGCTRGREEKLIPYLVKPEEITPGRSYWYASTCGACTASCGILTKNRDGRPIKLEGLPDQPVSKGGLCAVGQASVLGLYDSKRLKKPLVGGVEKGSIAAGSESLRGCIGMVLSSVNAFPEHDTCTFPGSTVSTIGPVPSSAAVLPKAM